MKKLIFLCLGLLCLLNSRAQTRAVRVGQYFNDGTFCQEHAYQLLQKEEDVLGYTHYRFQKVIVGVPVLGKQALIHTKNGKITFCQLKDSSDITIRTGDYISRAAALKSALSITKAKAYMWENSRMTKLLQQIKHDSRASYLPKGELVIVGKEHNASLERYHLAYQFDIFSYIPLQRSDVFVDAETGEILFSIDKKKAVNVEGTAVTKYSDTVKVTTEEFEGGYRLREIRGEGTPILTLNAQNKTVETITNDFAISPDLDSLADFVDEDNFWDNFNEQQDEVATDIHWATELSYDYFFDHHQRNSLDNKGMPLVSIAHLGVDWDEAFFLEDFMGYGDGGRLGPNTSIDVVAHEVTHGVVRHSANLLYLGESALLDEAFADIFGILVKYSAGRKYYNNLWSLGEDLGTFRNLAQPKLTGQPDTYKGENWYGGNVQVIFAHRNNGFINYWFYLLSEGGEGVNDIGTSYSIEKIGIEKAAQIAYRTLVYYLPSLAKVDDMAEGSIQATKDLFGEDAHEVQQVENAWNAVGVKEEQITTSLEGLEKDSKWLVYPNPIQDFLILETPTSSSDRTISILGMNGQEISKNKLRKVKSIHQINVENLISGLYFILDEEGNHYRFIKQ